MNRGNRGQKVGITVDKSTKDDWTGRFARMAEDERAALESEALIAYLRVENERLRAAFDAHHPPNSQEGYRCNVCGEDHPYIDPRAIPILIEDLCDIDD